MRQWQTLFGADFQAVFVFAYCLRQQPPDALFEELFAFGDRWYALREVALADYCREMVNRSGKWQTVPSAGSAGRSRQRTCSRRRKSHPPAETASTRRHFLPCDGKTRGVC
jgi:hypothetical protein